MAAKIVVSAEGKVSFAAGIVRGAQPGIVCMLSDANIAVAVSYLAHMLVVCYQCGPRSAVACSFDRFRILGTCCGTQSSVCGV